MVVGVYDLWTVCGGSVERLRGGSRGLVGGARASRPIEATCRGFPVGGTNDEEGAYRAILTPLLVPIPKPVGFRGKQKVCLRC